MRTTAILISLVFLAPSLATAAVLSGGKPKDGADDAQYIREFQPGEIVFLGGDRASRDCGTCSVYLLGEPGMRCRLKATL